MSRWRCQQKKRMSQWKLWPLTALSPLAYMRKHGDRYVRGLIWCKTPRLHYGSLVPIAISLRATWFMKA